jgi:UDP-2-acetamido-3-amino-2,3-dideoxy-glucuronate N-acetyltransferase
MAKANIAVIGSGYWGKNLVRNFHETGSLHTVCDSNEALLSQFKEKYPSISTCLAFNEVLGNEELRGVAIATPAETHYRLAKEALLAGKHVFVEKPLTLDEGHAEELIRLAADTGLTLMVGHLLQYHPVFISLKEMVRQGELGRIDYVYSNRLNLGKIRREENILWSFAPHDISMILALAGEMPKSIIATGGNYLHKEIADTTTTLLEFPGGMQAHVFVSWLHPFKEQKLVVVGDKKMAVFDDTQPWEDKLLLYPHQIKWEGDVPVPDKAAAERVDIPQSEPLRSECEHFLNCMETGSRPLTDGEEGLRVLSVLKDAQRSMDDNGKKICPQQTADKPTGPGIHPTAVIDDGVSIGQGSHIWHFSHVLGGSRVGEGCNVGQNVVIGPDVTVGDGCKIQNNVSVYTGVTLEDDVFCGPSMVFTNVYNPRSHIPRKSEIRETLVRKGATLGANCTIVCGHTIGKYAFVGAGAVVTEDVPDYALVVGNPARQVGWMCECGERLDEIDICKKCGKDLRDKIHQLSFCPAFAKDDIFIHETALVDERATIGKGTKIWMHAQIREHSKIGCDCILAKDVYIDQFAKIGDRCKIQNRSSIYFGVEIGDDVFIGPHVAFTNDRIPRAFNKDWQASPTFVKNGASLGANTTVRCGVTIGEYAMVAAGSVVTKDVEPYSLVMGNPAAHKYYIDKDGNPSSAKPDRSG